MEEQYTHGERGQALVIMVFGIVVLLIVAGLAVDGGTVLTERRHAQNAADASSLAGTRLLAGAICEEPSATDAAILAEVRRLAEENGVRNAAAGVRAEYVDQDETPLGMVGAGSIPVGSTGISATLEITRSTFFMGLAGIEKSAASAHALAMTGPIIRFKGGGMLPIGVPLETVEQLGPGDEFRVIETDHHHGGEFCTDDSGNWDDHNTDITCVYDPDVPHNAQRGWLNLNFIYNPDHLTAQDRLNRAFIGNVANSGCGSNDSLSTDDGLRGWASGDCPYPYPIIAGNVDSPNGDFIHGDPGARTSSLQELEQYVGSVAYAPIFDYVYLKDYMEDNYVAAEEPDVEGANTNGHWPTAGGGGHAFFYHIVGFVALEVQEVSATGSGKYLQGEFDHALIGAQVFRPSSGFGNGGCDTPVLFGVSLWR
jgi:hypothetical protein